MLLLRPEIAELLLDLGAEPESKSTIATYPLKIVTAEFDEDLQELPARVRTGSNLTRT